MWIFNTVINNIFGVLFYPFRSLNPWFAMTFISLLTAVLMLIVFRLTSNQEGISRVKNLIKAHLLEIRLFKDNMSASFRAQGNILRLNLKYIGYTLKPLLVMIVPLVLILIQLNLWFGHSALKPGDQTILKVKLSQGVNPLDTELKVRPSSSFSIESPPLRIEENREINWRLRAAGDKGHHTLTLTSGDIQVSKSIAVDLESLHKISTVRTGKKFFDQLFNPGEPPLPENAPISSIEIGYSEKKFSLFGWKIGSFLGVPGWLWVYFILSVIFAFALKGLFKVNI